MDQGCCKPVVTITVRRCVSSADSKLVLPLGKAGVSLIIGGGPSLACSSCGASDCFRSLGSPPITAAVAATTAIPHPRYDRLESFITFSHFLERASLRTASTEQQLIHAERESFAICEDQGPSHPCEDGKVQWRLDS